MKKPHEMNVAELNHALRTALEDTRLAGFDIHGSGPMSNRIGELEEELRDRTGGFDIAEAAYQHVSTLRVSAIREIRSPLLKALAALGYRFEEDDSAEDRSTQAAIVRALAGAAVDIQDPRLQSECSAWLEHHGDVNRSTERPSG